MLTTIDQLIQATPEGRIASRATGYPQNPSAEVAFWDLFVDLEDAFDAVLDTVNG